MSASFESLLGMTISWEEKPAIQTKHET